MMFMKIFELMQLRAIRLDGLLISIIVICLINQIMTANLNNFDSRMATKFDRGTLDYFELNDTQFFISSFQFNPSDSFSPWVQRIIGENALHFNASEFTVHWFYRKAELRMKMKAFQKRLQLPTSTFSPSCSIEMLGFILLNTDPESQFYWNNNHDYPITGLGDVKFNDFDSSSETTRCYYRSLYDIWRPAATLETAPNYQTVYIFCPIFKADVCRFLTQSVYSGKSTIHGEFRLYTSTITDTDSKLLITNFHVKPPHHQLHTSQLFRQVVKSLNTDASSSKKKVNTDIPLKKGVCLVLPYRSSILKRQMVNSAFLAEFVRYYSNVGFKVFVYDRDGSNYNSLFKRSKYKTYQNISMKNLDISYHPYTIRSMLDPSMKDMKYDNFMLYSKGQYKNVDTRRDIQNHDKTLTYSHCRFEAKALYGIDNILVVDSDEFVYCPNQPATIEGQKKHIHYTIQNQINKGFDQFGFLQSNVANRTDNSLQCGIDKIKSGFSIFDCYGHVNYIFQKVFPKTIHLGHKCPQTDVHSACNFPLIASHDCLCYHETLIIGDPIRSGPQKAFKDLCLLMHFSTNPKRLPSQSFYMPNNYHIWEKTRNELSEMSIIARSYTKLKN